MFMTSKEESKRLGKNSYKKSPAVQSKGIFWLS